MKKETIEEFLARGGKIQRFDAVPYDSDETVHSTSKAPKKLMSLLEGSDMFGEAIKRPRKNKNKLKEIILNDDIDLSMLPANLINKLNLKNGKVNAE